MNAEAAPILLTEMTLADQSVRDRIAHDLETTLIIEAAAGTGKTTALVSRIIAVLARGRATLDRIVAVTFTEKAAGELKLRLREAIEKARQNATNHDAAARARLTASLERLEEAHIGTIHSFCADLLRERPIAAGVDPAFEIAAEDEARELAGRAFDRWFEEALSAPGPALRRILRRRQLAEREGPRRLLMAAADALREWRDFDASWREEGFDRDAAIDRLVESILIAEAEARSADPDDWLRRSFERIAQPVREALRLETVCARDYDALEDVLLRLLIGEQRHWGWRGRGDRFGATLRAEAFKRRAELRAALEDFRERAGANLAPQLRAELAPIRVYYEKLKQSRGLLDFRDLLLLARDLVAGDRAIRSELQQRFTHIFVDEFQDTEPLQAELLLLLAAAEPSATDWREAVPAPGKLFIVGDPKQSIYRFRRADVALYQEIKRRLCAGGAALEHLTVSFRAVPQIQEMVNAAFAPLMAAETESQPRYAAMQPFRRAVEDQPAVIALPVPAPYGDYGNITKWSIERSLPDAVAACVAWLINESAWTVTERDGGEKREAIRARHICLLFRRLNQWRGGRARDVTREYVSALEARHIEHVLVRGGSFHQREEVEALRNALAAIERPDDELSVYATLRGSLFGFADGALLEYREALGSLHPFRPFPPESAAVLQEVHGALEVLRGLHRGRNRRPIAETIVKLLAATRAHAGIAIWPTGEQALANVTRLMDLARRYEAAGGARSLRGFVSLLEDRAEREEAGDAPVVEEGADGVRLMSVHSAKGLEFPVVILADPTCNETSAAPARFVDPAQRLCAQMLAGCAPRQLLEHRVEEHRRDEEEAVRVLYVAATRARDLLIVPVTGDERVEGWLSKLDPALYPPAAEALIAERHPAGCPEFKSGVAGFRPPNAQPKSRGVAPGAHTPECGSHQVVWWDPAVLGLDARESMGLRQTRLLEADETGERSARGQEEYAAWRVARAEMLSAGARASLNVAAATEWAAARTDAGADQPIAIAELPRMGERPHGARFGTLVHNVLARVALEASPAQVRELAEFFGRELGAPEQETGAASAAVCAALAAPLLRRAAAASEMRREAPLAVALEDGTLIEGVADLVFRETAPDGTAQWTVVDFKTDVDIRGKLEEYRAQLGLYLQAVRRATGDAITGVLFVV